MARPLPTLLLAASLCNIVAFAADGRAEGLRVVASIQPPADWARVVGGPGTDVRCLLPPGVSEHAFEPAPHDVKGVARADLYLQIGLGLETWASGILAASQNPKLRVVTLSDGVETLPLPRAGLDGGARGGETGPDPHLWLDPVRAQAMVARIAEAFAEADPAGREGYLARAAAYRAELEALDARWREGTAPFRGRRVVTMHGAWTYLFARYGIETAAVVEPFPGKEPSPKYLARLARLLRKEGTRVLFAEPQLSRKPAEVLARETGARVAILDPVGDPSVPERATYLKQMDWNLRSLTEALGEGP